MDPLISAILDAVFAALADSAGLSDWLRQRLKGDPEKLAFRAALTQALTAAAAQFPGRDVRYFAEILPQIGGLLLARYLQPSAPLPTGEELTQLWLNHLTIDSAIHYRQDFEKFATFLLDQLNQQIENQQPLQWIVQARRQRSSEDATRRLVEAAVQSAATLDALRHDVTQLTATLETALKADRSTVTTAGGAYVAGNVSAQNFAGRDLTIRNYFVAGLARLVIDYGPRIQDFLLEYLGSKRKRVPFGGRQAQLDELHAWLDDPAAPPYYLMTAEAGRGKSALVCRWLAQLTTRLDLDVIFVPISLRFETATQDVVFAALAARLANLYESEPEKLPPASLTAEQWKGVCQSYLRRSLPEGKQLLVILDGLDEATGWTPGRGLFSADPPSGLRVLVTARMRPGETASSGWAATLGWDNAQLARTANLPGLQRRGVEEALASMGNPLEHLATKVDVVGELHRLSEGDPLLVRLYVDALLAQGPAVATLRAEDLQTIQPGLGGYFERWWQEQQEQWRIQGRDPIVEQAQLRLLLNAIAAALGPLLLDDLAALHPDLADSLLVRRLLQQVSRWLVGDGKVQGYSYSHPRLGYYFWEQLGIIEQASWNLRFCNWGQHTLHVLNHHQLKPRDTPLYLVQYYTAHLNRSAMPPYRFYQLICNSWRLAWEEFDVSNIGFLNDIKHAWAQAQKTYNPALPNSAETLVQQIKSALCQSSVVAMGSNLLPELLAQSVACKLRTPSQALAITKLIPAGSRQEQAIIALAPYLSSELPEEVLSIIRRIADESARSSIIIATVPHLPNRFLSGALAIVETIQTEHFRASALSAFPPNVPESLMAKILEMTRKIGYEPDRASILRALAPYISINLLDEILSMAQMFAHESSQISVLSAFAPYLPPNLLEKALTLAQMIKGESARSTLLSAFAPYLPPNLLEKALTLAQMIKDESARSVALSAFTPRLPTPLISKVLSMAWIIKNEHARSSLLSAILPYLSNVDGEKVLTAALEAAQLIKSPRFRLSALTALASRLSEGKRSEVLMLALSEVQAIEYEADRASVLIALAPYLSKDVLSLTLNVAQAVTTEWHLASVLGALAPYLSDELLAVALTLIQNIRWEIPGQSAISKLACYLPEDLLKTALWIAQSINNAYERASALVALIPYLPQNEKNFAVVTALGSAQIIEDREYRLSSLRVLAPYLSANLLREVLNKVQAIGDERSYLIALRSLIPYLSGNLLVEALSIKQIIERKYSGLFALAYKYIPESLLTDALTTVQTIEDEHSRESALSVLAPYLSEGLLVEALSIARSIENERSRTLALDNISKYFPQSLLTNTLEGTQEIESKVTDENVIDSISAPFLSDVSLSIILDDDPIAAQSLKNVSDHVSIMTTFTKYIQEDLLTDALTIARSLEDVSVRVSALGAVASRMGEMQRSIVLREALATSLSIDNEYIRASSLGDLAPYLSIDLLTEAFSAAEAIKNSSDCAYALGRLAPYFPPDQGDIIFAKSIALAQTVDTALLARLVMYWAEWGANSPILAHYSFAKALQEISLKPRPVFLADLAALMPFILALAGDEAPEAAAGIFQAIQDVCAWWP